MVHELRGLIVPSIVAGHERTGCHGTTTTHTRAGHPQARWGQTLVAAGKIVDEVCRQFEIMYLTPQMPSWQVWWLAVAEGARRQGIAKSLLGELESRARAQDVGRLWLWTWGRARAARACYAAAGWDPINRTVFELEGDARGAIETHWVYLRQLRAPVLATDQVGES